MSFMQPPRTDKSARSPLAKFFAAHQRIEEGRALRPDPDHHGAAGIIPGTLVPVHDRSTAAPAQTCRRNTQFRVGS